MEKIYKWLSPPKESINYNAAYAVLKSQPNTCLWFINGNFIANRLGGISQAKVVLVSTDTGPTFRTEAIGGEVGK